MVSFDKDKPVIPTELLTQNNLTLFDFRVTIMDSFNSKILSLHSPTNLTIIVEEER
jgi:hypothetical protein